MTVVLIIATIIIFFLINKGRKGPAEMLPYFCFIIIIIPHNADIELGNFPNINMQRLSLTILFLSAIFFKNKNFYKSIKIFYIPFFYLIILTIITGLVSTIFSINFVVSIKDWLMNVIEFYLLYFVLVKSIRNIEDINKIVYWISIAIFIVTIFGLIETYMQWHPAEYLPAVESRLVLARGGSGNPDLYSRGFRPKGGFPASQLLATTMVLGMVISAYLITKYKSITKKYLYLASMLFMGLLLYKTMSRGPWLAAGIAFMFLFSFSTIKIRKIVFIFGMVVIIFLLFRSGVYDTISRLYIHSSDTNSVLGSSYEYRFVLIDIAQEYLSRDMLRMFFGYGPETFFYLNITAPFLDGYYNFLSCDSSWVEFAMDLGLIGLFSMGLLLGYIVIYIWRNIKYTSEENRNLLSIILSFIFAYYFLMTNISIYGWVQMGYLFWIIVALAISIIRLEKESMIEKHVL